MSFQFKTLTPYHLAKLSEQAYVEIPEASLEGWQLLSISVLNDYSYHGVAYIHFAEKRVVISHCGSDFDLLSNILSDASLAISRLPDAQEVAKGFSEEVRCSVSDDYEVIETGHSLGAFHAEMNVALLGNAYAITFESPGIGAMCETLHLSPDPDRFIAYFSNPNVVNTAKPHIGHLYRIYTYHVDKEGYKLSQGGYLQELAKGMLQSYTPVDSAYHTSVAILKTAASKFVQSQELYHGLKSLINAMHPHIGYPWLMREMRSWPSMSEFLRGQVSVPVEISSNLSSISSSSGSSSDSNLNSVLYTQLVAQNKRAEAALSQLTGYEAGAFIIPADLHQGQKKWFAKAYQLSALSRFDVFYEDAALREDLTQRLGLSVAESEVLPQVPAVNSPKSVLSPEKPITHSVLSPAVKFANSLVSERHLIEEEKWLVSLVKSPGDREHAFLLLEGIRDGVPIHIRTDFFLDLDARKEVVARLPVGVASGVNALWGSSENLVGRGFVRTEPIQPSQYEELLGNCVHQSWGISRRQADELIERFAAEVRKPYTYAIVGNHPSSSVSSSSMAQPHNCVSWCQKILSEELHIQVGSKWSLVKRPSIIVREAIDAHTASSPSGASGSSSFFSNAMTSSISSSQSSSSKSSTPSSKSSLADRFRSQGF